MKKDLLVRGHIWTGEEKAPFAEAFLVRDGVFQAVGSFREIEKRISPREAEILDARNGLVLPGLSDSHIHLTAQAKQNIYINLKNVTSLEATLRKIREESRHIPRNAWIRAINYNEEIWSEEGDISREILDELNLDNPLIVSRYCGHRHVANTRGLRQSGLWNSSNPDVLRNSRGEPTGILIEGAAGPIIAEIAKLYETPGKIREGLAKTCMELSSFGVTAVHICDAPSYALAEDLWAFQDLEKKDLLPLRVTSYHEAFPNYSFRSGFGSSLLRFGGFKLFCDGNIGGRTAALSSPFSDDEGNCGKLNYADEELYYYLIAAQERNIQVQIHVIGDRAVDQALRCIERVVRKKGQPFKPYRLNHVSYCPATLMSKIRELGIIVDVQPTQAYRNQETAPKRLGNARMPFTYPYRKLVDAGILLTGSSDGPVENINPWVGIWAAVNRRGDQGFPLPYEPLQDRLTLSEALRMYTVNPWIALEREGEIGKICPSFKADFAILEGNPFDTPPEKLRDLRVLYTFLGGKCVWKQGGSPCL